MEKIPQGRYTREFREGEHPILMRQGRPIQTGIKCYKNSILKRKIL